MRSGMGVEYEEGQQYAGLTLSEVIRDAVLQGHLHKAQVCVGDGVSHGIWRFCHKVFQLIHWPMPPWPLSSLRH